MSEDTKSKLKEKLGTAVSEEELEKVAGGTYQQNLELLNALKQIDPQGVTALFDSLTPGNEKGDIADGTVALVKKNLGINAVTPSNLPNYYHNEDYSSTKGFSHSQILKMINDKANAAKEAGFEIL